MNQSRVCWISLASGCVWALIGFAVAFILKMPGTTFRQSALDFAGGMIAAPFIGLLMGQVSRIFGHLEVGMRIILAGASLYAASVLFVMASLLLSSLRLGFPIRDFWMNSFAAAWIGFSTSCVLIWPIAYANHALISRAWEQSRDRQRT
jgi:hypothetical protein